MYTTERNQGFFLYTQYLVILSELKYCKTPIRLSSKYNFLFFLLTGALTHKLLLNVLLIVLCKMYFVITFDLLWSHHTLYACALSDRVVFIIHVFLFDLWADR